MLKKSVIAVALGGLVLAGCTTMDPYTREEKTSHATRGAIFGGLAGAAIGALTNTSSGEQAAKNALIGAGIGALAGGAIGGYMDQQELELRQRLERTGVSVTRVGDQIVLNMPSDITFDLGSAEVRGQFYQVLADVALVLTEFEQTYVEVAGYTDTTGSANFNQDLSQRRAENVARVLASNGVMPQRLIVQGFGETRLKVRTADGVNEPANRRVEITISPLTTS